MAKTNAFPGIVKPKKPRKAGRRTVSPATFIANSRRVSSEQKAIWHNVTGTGRAGTLRVFFDLNAGDKQACLDALETLVSSRLRRV